jgi:perosamine synthetase
VAEMYSRKLEGTSGLLLPAESHTAKRSWFAYVIQVQGPRPNIVRDRLMKSLRERGIGCQPYFPPIHLQPYFREAGMAPSRPLPHTEWAAKSCLALPFFSAMTEEQVSEVCAATRELLADLGAADDTATMRYSAAADAAD